MSRCISDSASIILTDSILFSLWKKIYWFGDSRQWPAWSAPPGSFFFYLGLEGCCWQKKTAEKRLNLMRSHRLILCVHTLTRPVLSQVLVSSSLPDNILNTGEKLLLRYFWLPVHIRGRLHKHIVCSLMKMKSFCSPTSVVISVRVKCTGLLLKEKGTYII
jgi:hypothetical protein